jgi:preprotein translocase subunit SecE
MASSDAKDLFVDAKSKQVRLMMEQQKKTKISSSLQQLKEELKKITWTSKEELKFCTKVVIGATFVFGIGIYLVDLLIKGILMGLSSLFHGVFG